MASIDVIKTASLLNVATDGYILTTSAAVSVDVSVAGSPGNLSPEGFIPGGIAKWVDRSSGISLGFPVFTLSSRAPTKTSRVTRVLAKYIVPTLETAVVGVPPTKAYEHVANIEFLLPERGSAAERLAFYSRTLSLMVRRIAASDLTPVDLTGTPLIDAVLLLDKPY